LTWLKVTGRLLALSFFESVESLYSSFIACGPWAETSAEPERSALELQAITQTKQASVADTIKSFIFILGV
jgi:hypothetical protein